MALTRVKLAAALAAGLLFCGPLRASAAPIYVLAHDANEIVAQTASSTSGAASAADKDKDCEAGATPTANKSHHWWRLDLQVADWLGLRHRQAGEFQAACESTSNGEGSGGGARGAGGGSASGAAGGSGGGQRPSGLGHNPGDSSSFSSAFGANDDQDRVSDDFFGVLDDQSDFFADEPPFTGGDGNEAGADLPLFSNSLTDLENPQGAGDNDPPNRPTTTLTDFQAAPVPEPATLWLTATGLAAALRLRRKIKR